MEPQRAHKLQRPQPPASPPPQRQPGAATSDPSSIWLPELVQRFAVLLTSNEVACALRLVNKATAAQFSSPQHTTIRLSQPVPHHAFVRCWAGPDAMRTLARQQRLELLRLTARSGSIANLEVLLARDISPPVLDCHVLIAAAGAGQLDACVWLQEQGYRMDVRVLMAAAKGGQQAVCEWLLANGCPGEGLAPAAAARGGRVGLMVWLLLCANNIDIGTVLKGAAEGCDLPTLQRLHHTLVDTLPGGLPSWDKTAIISAAAGSPTADWQAKVEWLEARGYPQAEGACEVAAAKPDVLVRLGWLRQRGYPLSSYAAAYAAGAGNVAALQHVLGQGVEVDATVMWRAARGGHVAVMEMLHAHGARMGEEMVRTAAVAGHLPAVAWLVERLGTGAALTARVFAAAAQSGSMELLAWLREMGCPWSATVFAAAAEGGSEEQLEWLADQGCPMGDDGEPYARLAAKGELDVLRCLLRLGCPRSPDGGTFTRAIKLACVGDIERDVGQHVERGLLWLLDQGCPVDWDKAESAACNEVVKRWLLAQRRRQGWLYYRRDLLAAAGLQPPRTWEAAEAGRRGAGEGGTRSTRELLGPMEPQRARKRQLSQSPAPPPQQRQPAAATSDPSRIWLPELVQRFAVSLTSNEVACALRLVNKATAAQFSAPQHTTVRLSQPVPHHAFVRRWAGPDAMRTLARQQRLELPRLTARSGSIANLEVLLARDDSPLILDRHVLIAAAGAGQLDVCVWLQQQGYRVNVWAVVAAAKGGQQAVCEWLLANGCLEEGSATAAAAKGGHVGLMDWLLLRVNNTDVADVLRGAAEGCDLHTLQRLHHTLVDTLAGGLSYWCKTAIISAAAGSPTEDWQAKVEWLEARGYPQSVLACVEAAAKPDALPRLQWLWQRGYPLDSAVAGIAAGAGNVEALQYVLGQGLMGAPEMRCAAQGGHVAVMEVLHARGVPIVEDAVRTAAAAGHLPAVAWLMERLGAHTALTARVFAAATQSGSMGLLGWLRARGCQWDAAVYAAAAEGGSEEQLEWLAEQGCPMGDDGEPYVRAAYHGDLAMLRCLRRLGCPWGPDDGSTLTRAVEKLTADTYDSRGIVERVLSFLLDEGCPVDWGAAEAAAQDNNDEELMGWLQAQRKQRAPSPPPQRQPAAATSDPSSIWLPELVQRFAVSLTSNEVACALRLVNKAMAAQFSAPQHTTIRLSQPVPHHAFVRRWAGPDAMRTLARQQRLELLRLTARSGSIANLEVLLARDDSPPALDCHVLIAAAGAGQLDACVWLQEQGYRVDVRVLMAAAKGGQQAVCEWLLANGCPEEGWAIAAAAKGGHVGLMDWLLLRVNNTDVDDVLKGAAEGCDLHTLQRLHHTLVDTLAGGLSNWCKTTVISAAAGSPTADWQAKVEWLEARRYPRGVWACRVAAAKPGGLVRLGWLQQRGYPLDSSVAACAANAGNVEALQYVLGQGVEMDATVMWCAARGGHVAVMEVLHAHGVPIVEEAVRTAAAAGHLPAVAWLVERLGAHTALTARVFAAATQSGSMGLLGWLRARGCPWDAAVYAAAAEGGSEEQLEWLAEQGCPMGDDGEPYVRAAYHGDLAMLRCLRRLGCPWGPDDGSTLTRAVEKLTADTYDSRGIVERVLSFLLDEGCPVDWGAAEAAAQDNKDKELMGWLQAQRKQRARAGSDGLRP
ncbi:Ankyrin repeat domain-containing protein [Tetrabaena socialis]|uniref:Ankyrin repeat domain-containing protein n=1 Tax=Tetrabaena socialis TaxID=47790 RepID=A0A2J8A7L4_9CHLO|nr:Ankyrin repeat domain-containing protein [Tetrabaena socialis]|eukprot:PNH08507.1 Ankyrin repeat domain-containing protein [Tetrabaena socialis]